MVSFKSNGALSGLCPSSKYKLVINQYNNVAGKKCKNTGRTIPNGQIVDVSTNNFGNTDTINVDKIQFSLIALENNNPSILGRSCVLVKISGPPPRRMKKKCKCYHDLSQKCCKSRKCDDDDDTYIKVRCPDAICAPIVQIPATKGSDLSNG